MRGVDGERAQGINGERAHEMSMVSVHAGIGGQV
jgi:hypothetical protein